MRFALSFLALVALSGCQMHAEKASLSSGRIGCAPQQIAISEDSVTFNTASWKATCQGRTFYCVRRAYEDTTCTAALVPVAAQQGVPATQALAVPSSSSGATKEQELEQLQRENISYEEYQRRYRAMMAK